MKVLHVINSLELGGAEKLLSDFLPTLIQTGKIETDLLVLSLENAFFLKDINKSKVKVFESKFRIRDPRNILFIVDIVNQGGYEIVHSHTFPSQYWVSLAKSRFKNNVKLVTTEHSSHNNRRKIKALKYLEKYIYNKNDMIISISDDVYESLNNWINGNSISKNILIPNGVNLHKIDKTQPLNPYDFIDNYRESLKLIGMVARFVDAKDQPTLIKALQYLPNEYQVVLVGDGPLLDKTVNLTTELGLENRVHFLGKRNNPIGIIKACDVVVLSSHWEGHSLSSIEGLASGRPFIASNVKGLSDVVKGAGLLFEEGNAIQLAKLIEKSVNDQQFAQYIIRNSKLRSKDYSLDEMVRKHLIIYRELVGGE